MGDLLSRSSKQLRAVHQPLRSLPYRCENLSLNAPVTVFCTTLQRAAGRG